MLSIHSLQQLRDGEGLLRRLRPVISPAAATFMDGLRTGSYDGHLEAGTAVRVAGLFRYALGISPLDGYQVEFGKVGAPGVVLEDLVAGLTSAIEELTRTRLQHVASGGSTPRFRLDIGGYRASRRPNLEVLVDEVIEKVRTSGKALARMVELAGAAADRARMAGRIVDIEVQHLDFAARATEVADSLSERVADAGEIRVGELGAVVGAHVGPGTLAITVSPRPEGGR